MSTSLLAKFRSRIHWVDDEPGTLLVLLILFAFLLFSPGGACTITPVSSAEHAPVGHSE